MMPFDITELMYNKNKKLQLNLTLCTIFCFYASRIPSQDLCPSPGERRCYGWPTAHAPAGERPEDSCRLDSYYSEEEAWLVSESPRGFNCSVFATVRSHIGSSQFGSGLSPRRAVKSSSRPPGSLSHDIPLRDFRCGLVPSGGFGPFPKQPSRVSCLASYSFA